MTFSKQKIHEIRMLALLMLKIPRQTMEQRFADEGLDLTMLQHLILSMAERHQPTIADMSRILGLDPSTLVPTVDAMVKKGYLTRERDPNDRRRYPLHLTEQGQALHHHICHNMGDDPLSEALSQLDDDELSAFNQTLRKVVSHLPDGDNALIELDEQIRTFQFDTE